MHISSQSILSETYYKIEARRRLNHLIHLRRTAASRGKGRLQRRNWETARERNKGGREGGRWRRERKGRGRRDEVAGDVPGGSALRLSKPQGKLGQTPPPRDE